MTAPTAAVDAHSEAHLVADQASLEGSQTSLRNVGNKIVDGLGKSAPTGSAGTGGVGGNADLIGAGSGSMLGDIMQSYSTCTLPPGKRYSIGAAAAHYEALAAQAGIDLDETDVNIDDLRMLRHEEGSEFTLEDDSDDDVGYSLDEDAKATNLKLAQKERSILQMVDVLCDRLTSLNAVVINRYNGCKSDLDEATEFRSSRTKKMAIPGTGVEEDAHLPHRGEKTKRVTSFTFNHAAAPTERDGNHIVDPARLTFRNAPVTDAGRKLEHRFEREYGSAHPSSFAPKFKTMGTSKLKWMGQKKVETRKQERMFYERKLQSNLERYVTRAVSDVIYQVPGEQGPADNDSPTMEEAPLVLTAEMAQESFPIPVQGNEMNPKLLLSYACERIVLPGGARIFKHFVMTVESQQLFVYLFWFVHCKFFQENSQDEQAHLLRLVSAKYVKVLGMEGMDDYKDLFFKHYPFLVANAIFWGFHYLCPGSRHLYSNAFKRVLYLQCARFLSGVEVTPALITEMQAKLFPDEVGEAAEDLDYHPPSMHSAASKSATGVVAALAVGDGGGAKREGSRPVSPQDGVRAGGKEPQLGGRGGAMGVKAKEGGKEAEIGGAGGAVANAGEKCAGERVMKGQVGAEGTMMQRMSKTFRPNPLSAYTGDRSTLRFKPLMTEGLTTLRPRQQRMLFDAAQISPMLQEHLGHSSSTAGRRSENIIRTVPVAWCQSGGIDTYRRNSSRKEIHESINREHTRAKREYARAKMRSSEELRRAARQLQAERHCIFKRGPRHIGLKSMDIVTELQQQGALKGLKRPKQQW